MKELIHTSFNRVGLIIRQQISHHADHVNAICDTISRHGEVMVYFLDDPLELDGFPTASIEQIGETADLAVSIGGDGTLLSAARLLVDFDIPLVGINLGRLGFLADVTVEDLEQHISRIFNGEFSVEKRFLLQGDILRQDGINQSHIALNDIVLHSHESTSMIEFAVYSDEELINRQRADGLIVSTPTGSTAYSLSGGGPIMHPALEALALVPICPHTLSNRPIVLPSDKHIEIRLSQPGMIGQISFDGQHLSIIERQDQIHIQRYSKSITLLHPAHYDYFEILRAKLKWSNQP